MRGRLVVGLAAAALVASAAWGKLEAFRRSHPEWAGIWRQSDRPSWRKTGCGCSSAAAGAAADARGNGCRRR